MNDAKLVFVDEKNYYQLWLIVTDIYCESSLFNDAFCEHYRKAGITREILLAKTYVIKEKMKNIAEEEGKKKIRTCLPSLKFQLSFAQCAFNAFWIIMLG